MIGEIIKGNYNFQMQLVLVSCVWIAVLIAMGIDFYFGLKKAKELKEARTSEGYRRTINKFVYYYAMLSFALIFDFLDVITPVLFPFPLNSAPLVSILCALGLIFTEAKSVREKAEDKVRRRADESFKELIKIAAKRQDLMNNIVEDLTELKKQQDEKQ